MSVLNIAHRGFSARYPENTLAAFEAAIQAGAWMCELDVHLTRDRVPVVIHDEKLERTTSGQGMVGDLTLAEIKALVAAGKFREFQNERVPTLEEVLALVHGRCGLNVEIKCRGAERAVCDLIRRHDEVTSSMVSSFEWDTLAAVRGIDSEIRLGLLAEEDPQRLLEAAVAMQAFAINPRFDLVDRELCRQAHERGLQVLVWTVDAPDAMRALIGNGVDGIMTNYPDRLAALIR